MKIDRHNYEEFFLLYIDNELSAEEREQVEMFVLANSDLEEEFVMLQQSKLIADEEIIFDRKDLLLKETSITETTEESIILYLDNELTASDRKKAEEAFAADPSLQHIVSDYRQARLDPSEKIVFTDKAGLYRKEEGRVIAIKWWRAAAAALLIVGAGVAAYRMTGLGRADGGIRNSVASHTTTVKKEKPVSSEIQAPGKKDESPVVSTENKQQDPNKQIALSTQIQKQQKRPDENTTVKKPANDISISKIKDQLLADNNLTNDQPEPDRIRPAIVNNLKTEISTASTSRISNAIGMTDKLQHKQIVNDPAVTKDDSGTPNNYASNSENKKLRGFFRKATRFIERTTNINPANSDNKLLIGGMAINLK
jgi:hypothetical protein